MQERLTNATSGLAAALVLLAFGCVAPARAQGEQGGERYALLIGGLGGTEAYDRAFQEHLLKTRKALTQDFQFPEAHVTVLAAAEADAPDFVDGASTAENIEAQFRRLAEQVTENDAVYVVLFGHGSYDGQQAYLNIPKRDLSAADYADLVGGLGAGRVVFVNTASASAPFIGALSASGRIVVTATRTGTQRNATSFPTFMVEALTSAAAADMDKDGALSVREVFTYASDKTAQSFEEAGALATERALLDDTGDGSGHSAEELQDVAEGALAASTFLRRATGGAAGGVPPDQLRAQEALRREIAELQSRKSQLAEEAYYDQLETLFVRLARLNRQIEALP